MEENEEVEVMERVLDVRADIARALNIHRMNRREVRRLLVSVDDLLSWLVAELEDVGRLCDHLDKQTARLSRSNRKLASLASNSVAKYHGSRGTA